ncbi:MAG: c-type cytochrome [Steroidobacteraceae bacterium]|nr:c-type cytochrome [Steroidobacteraceae bacterium]MDW8258530.1 c-type cytochrome [Gammaproteobacteria bacterium]
MKSLCGMVCALLVPAVNCAAGVSGGTVPRLAGQHYRVLVKQIVDFRHGRRWDDRMEHFADRHHLPTAQSVADVAAYVAELRSAPAPAGGNGENLAVGARSYFDKCSRCHGAAGHGDNARLIPRLAGQHYLYLVRQLYDGAEGRRPNMSRAHRRLLLSLDKASIEGIADYLSRMVDTRDAAPLPP